MSVIPLHLQRKVEQRWAARFVASAAPKGNRLKGALDTSPHPVKAKEKPSESSKPTQQGL